MALEGAVIVTVPPFTPASAPFGPGLRLMVQVTPVAPPTRLEGLKVAPVTDPALTNEPLTIATGPASALVAIVMPLGCGPAGGLITFGWIASSTSPAWTGSYSWNIVSDPLPGTSFWSAATCWPVVRSHTATPSLWRNVCAGAPRMITWFDTGGPA